MKKHILLFATLFLFLNVTTSYQEAVIDSNHTDTINFQKDSLAKKDSVYVIEIGLTKADRPGYEDDPLYDTQMNLVKQIFNYIFKRTIIYNNEKTVVLTYDDNLDVATKTIYNSIDSSLTYIKYKYESNEVVDSTKESMIEVFDEMSITRIKEKIKKDGVYIENRDVRKDVFGLDAYQVKYTRPVFKDFQNFKVYLTDDIPFINNEMGNLLKIQMSLIMETRIAKDDFIYSIGVVSHELDLSKQYLLD